MTQNTAAVELDLRRDLPKVRKQYSKVLAAQKIMACDYTAPCVVGAMIPPSLRHRLQSLGHKTALWNGEDPLGRRRVMTHECTGCGLRSCSGRCFDECPADYPEESDLRKAHPEWVEAAKEDQLTETQGDPLKRRRAA